VELDEAPRVRPRLRGHAVEQHLRVRGKVLRERAFAVKLRDHPEMLLFYKHMNLITFLQISHYDWSTLSIYAPGGVGFMYEVLPIGALRR